MSEILTKTDELLEAERSLPDYAGVAKLLGRRDIQYFFILGMQKSGTSWVQRMLSAHPEVAIAPQGEMYILNYLPEGLRDIKKSVAKKNWYYQLSEDDIRFISRVFLQYSLLKIHGKDAKIVGEKSPNYRSILPFINEVFPSCKIIHVIRDPRDVIVSAFFHIRRGDPQFLTNTYNIAPDAPVDALPESFVLNHAQKYARDVRKAKEEKCLFNPKQYLEIKYEDLQDGVLEHMKNVLTFLKVSIDYPIIERCIEAAAFEKFSGGRKKGEEDSMSFFRKGIVGDWKNYLTRSQEEAVVSICGELMSELGYC